MGYVGERGERPCLTKQQEKSEKYTGSQQPAQPRLAYTPVGLDGFRSLTRWDPRIPGLRYAALGLTHLTGLEASADGTVLV